ncbi:MAG: HEAT repeat domain-containing protein [Gemmataceae bacterium]|nr:HEAT repeat domain-containing protein [Gemmataceae bacterium]
MRHKGKTRFFNYMNLKLLRKRRGSPDERYYSISIPFFLRRGKLTHRRTTTQEEVPMSVRRIESIAALCLLWFVQPIAAKTVPDLIQRLQDERPEARRQAIDELAKIGPKAEPAIPRLAKLLEDDHNGTYALDALVSIGVASVPALTDVLANSKNGNARRWAAVALGEIAPKAKQTSIPALAAALTDPDRSVRSYSAKSLSNFRADAKPALAALVKVLDDEYVEARQHAALALGHIGPDAKPARDALTKALGDKSYIVQLHAAWALERIGPEAKSIPGLVGIVRNGHPLATRDRSVDAHRAGGRRRDRERRRPAAHRSGARACIPGVCLRLFDNARSQSQSRRPGAVQDAQGHGVAGRKARRHRLSRRDRAGRPRCGS